MEHIYNSVFNIGSTVCTLVSVRPYQQIIVTNSTYYEHNHHYFEIHSVKQGQCTYQCGGNTLTIDSTNLLLLPPKLYHKAISSSDDCVRMCLSFQMKNNSGQNAENNAFFYDTFGSIHYPILLEHCQPLKDTLFEISDFAQMDEADFLVREKLKVSCNSLLLSLFESLAKEDHRNTAGNYTAAPSKEYVIDTFFATHFMSRGAKEELAALLHVSPRQLHRLLTNHYGKNYREKQNEIRVQVATGFLLDTDKSIAEIAALMGYTSPENFATFIKKETGRTPGQIRRNGPPSTIIKKSKAPN